jgi:hypothetical protein
VKRIDTVTGGSLGIIVDARAPLKLPEDRATLTKWARHSHEVTDMTNSIVERNVVINKARRLPAPGEVLVRLRDQVTEDTTIARGRVRNTELVEIRVDQRLGVDAMDVAPYMLKKEGDAVKRDEVIALRRSFFGSSTKVLRAPLDGTIEAFSRTSGKLLIRGLPILIEVQAHIPGRVTECFRQGRRRRCRGAITRSHRCRRGGDQSSAHHPTETLTEGPHETTPEGGRRRATATSAEKAGRWGSPP